MGIGMMKGLDGHSGGYDDSDRNGDGSTDGDGKLYVHRNGDREGDWHGDSNENSVGGRRNVF